MKVFIKGTGEVNLAQQDFVATGGQASVYVKGSTAYKVYTDPKDAIPYAKFQALSAIQDPCVINPQDLLLDKANNPIGYTMQAVKDTYSLVQFFVPKFRERTKVTQDNIVDIAAKLQGHIKNIHKADTLVVDLNELNILVPQTFDETYLIDVDSYQTKGYPATVIMPSVRDYSVSSKDFSPLSDWFSYGVLAFQLFIGVHPYKGTHPGSAGIDKDKRLEHRMRHNLSAFRSDVSLPNCCYSFDVIPQVFRDWLKAVLDDGKRVLPPDPRGGPVAVLTSKMTPFLIASGNLVIQEVKDYSGWQLMQYEESNGSTLLMLQKGLDTRILLNGRTLYDGPTPSGETLIGFTPKMNHPIALNRHQGELTLYDLQRKTQENLGIRTHELDKSGDRFYIRNGGRILEVEFSDLAKKILVTASHVVADVLERASHLHEGCVIQSMLGSVYVSLFPRSKAGYQIRIPELDSYKVVDAKFDGGVLMVVGAKQGIYDRMVFRFNEDYTEYDLRTVSDVIPSGLNFITLASGICCCITEEEKVEAFSAKKGSQGLKIVEDPAIGNDMTLFKVNGKVGFGRAGKVYQMSLK